MDSNDAMRILIYDREQKGKEVRRPARNAAMLHQVAADRGIQLNIDVVDHYNGAPNEPNVTDLLLESLEDPSEAYDAVIVQKNAHDAAKAIDAAREAYEMLGLPSGRIMCITDVQPQSSNGVSYIRASGNNGLLTLRDAQGLLDRIAAAEANK